MALLLAENGRELVVVGPPDDRQIWGVFRFSV